METVSPPIYAALLGGALLCLQIILMLTVGTYRSNSGKGVGVADDMKLEQLVSIVLGNGKDGPIR